MKTRPVKLPSSLKRHSDTPEEPTLHRRPRVTLRDVLARCEAAYLEYLRCSEVASPYDYITSAGKQTREAFDTYFIALGELPGVLAKEHGFKPTPHLLGYLARAQAAHTAYIEAVQNATDHSWFAPEHVARREMFEQWFISLSNLHIHTMLEVNR